MLRVQYNLVLAIYFNSYSDTFNGGQLIVLENLTS